MESIEISAAQEHRLFREALRHRRAGGHGAGPFLLPAHRHHPQYPRQPVPHRLSHRADCRKGPLYRRRPDLLHERPRYGHRYRLRLAGPAAGVVLSGAPWAMPATCWAARAARFAVLFVAIIAAECGKAVSKETKIDILVTPIVTTLIGVGAAYLIAPPIGAAASAFGQVIMQATALQPFLMGILVSVLVGIALTLPISSGRHLLRPEPDRACRRRRRGRLLRADGGFCRDELPGKRLGRSHQPGPRHLHAANAEHREKSPGLDRSHCHLRHHRSYCHLSVPSGNEWRGHQLRHGNLRPVRPTGCLDRLGGLPSEAAVANGAAAIIPTAFDWAGLLLISFILPAILCPLINQFCRRAGWVKDGDLKLP